MLKPLLVALAFIVLPVTPGLAQWITRTSDASAAQTADRLEAAIETAGATVFARVDHAAGAENVGLDLEPTILVIFGNPEIGTPIIAADRRAGLDLPIRVLIWEEDGETNIGYEDPAALRERYGISDADDAFEMMSGALDALTSAAANEQ